MTEEQMTGEIQEAAAPAAETQATLEPQMVPVDALQAERRERQQLQEEVKVLRDHMVLMDRRTPEPVQETLPGMADDDILTVGEAKKYIKSLDDNYRSSIQEIRFSQANTDYEEVVRQYLPEVIKENPRLRETLQNNSDFELAYHLAKNSKGYREANFGKTIHPDAEKLVQNTQRAGSLSQTGSTAPVNSVKNYKQMTDADFMKQVHRNLGYV